MCFVSAWKKCLLAHPRSRASSMKSHQGRRGNEKACLHEFWFVLVGARQGGGHCWGLVAESVYNRWMELSAETVRWERSGTASLTHLAWSRWVSAHPQSIGVARQSARGRRSGLERVHKGLRVLHEAKMKIGTTNWWGQKDKRVCASKNGGHLSECKGRWGWFEPARCKRAC